MTVYKNPDFIKRLISSYPLNFDIYIHIDAKSDIKDSEFSYRNRRVFCKKEYKINWGGLNHLKAFLSLLYDAYKVCRYDYYHLVTGQDVFVTTETEFNDFFLKYPKGTSFIEAYKIPEPKYPVWESGWGIFDYFMFSDILNYNLKTKFGQRIFGITKKIHKLCRIRRKRPPYPVYIGSLYCSLSNYAVEKLTSSVLKDTLLHRLNYTLCGEGVYFQTILRNENCPIWNQNLTYTDWKTSKEKPKILDLSDYGKWGKDKFFIRKVDPVKSDLLLKQLNI